MGHCFSHHGHHRHHRRHHGGKHISLFPSKSYKGHHDIDHEVHHNPHHVVHHEGNQFHLQKEVKL